MEADSRPVSTQAPARQLQSSDKPPSPAPPPELCTTGPQPQQDDLPPRNPSVGRAHSLPAMPRGLLLALRPLNTAPCSRDGSPSAAQVPLPLPFPAFNASLQTDNPAGIPNPSAEAAGPSVTIPRAPVTALTSSLSAPVTGQPNAPNDGAPHPRRAVAGPHLVLRPVRSLTGASLSEGVGSAGRTTTLVDAGAGQPREEDVPFTATLQPQQPQPQPQPRPPRIAALAIGELRVLSPEELGLAHLPQPQPPVGNKQVRCITPFMPSPPPPQRLQGGSAAEQQNPEPIQPLPQWLQRQTVGAQNHAGAPADVTANRDNAGSPAADDGDGGDGDDVAPDLPADLSNIILPSGPVEVTVGVRAPGMGGRRPRRGAARALGGALGLARGGYMKGPICGTLDLERYLVGRDCILHEGNWMSRSNFEKLGGSRMAKWYRSIRVLPSLETLGDWLERHNLPVARGPNRRSAKRLADSGDELWPGMSMQPPGQQHQQEQGQGSPGVSHGGSEGTTGVAVGAPGGRLSGAEAGVAPVPPLRQSSETEVSFFKRLRNTLQPTLMQGPSPLIPEPLSVSPAQREGLLRARSAQPAAASTSPTQEGCPIDTVGEVPQQSNPLRRAPSSVAPPVRVSVPRVGAELNTLQLRLLRTISGSTSGREGSLEEPRFSAPSSPQPPPQQQPRQARQPSNPLTTPLPQRAGLGCSDTQRSMPGPGPYGAYRLPATPASAGTVPRLLSLPSPAAAGDAEASGSPAGDTSTPALSPAIVARRLVLTPLQPQEGPLHPGRLILKRVRELDDSIGPAAPVPSTATQPPAERTPPRTSHQHQVVDALQPSQLLSEERRAVAEGPIWPAGAEERPRKRRHAPSGPDQVAQPEQLGGQQRQAQRQPASLRPHHLQQQAGAAEPLRPQQQEQQHQQHQQHQQQQHHHHHHHHQQQQATQGQQPCQRPPHDEEWPRPGTSAPVPAGLTLHPSEGASWPPQGRDDDRLDSTAQAAAGAAGPSQPPAQAYSPPPLLAFRKAARLSRWDEQAADQLPPPSSPTGFTPPPSPLSPAATATQPAPPPPQVLPSQPTTATGDQP